MSASQWVLVSLLLAAAATPAAGWSLFGGSGEETVENSEYDTESTNVVGARIETCRGCRLNYLPRVRNFIQHHTDKFPALSVKFIHGAPPEILWLNEFGQEVGRDPLDDYNEKGIEKLLSSKGITKSTKAPTFKAFRFKPTEYCLAFRGTDMCNPKEMRILSMDKHCDKPVGEDDAGHCECRRGVKLPVNCGERSDMPLTCEALCKDILTGEMLMESD